MHINLSENIRTFRKARSLTQEQLAETLGVTVGAVYKWEAKLSTPDINLIVKLADLFDTSVDVLLGYEVKNNKQKAMVERMKSLMQNRDEQALTEAEKALNRYPNCFDIVYQSANLYHMFGLINRDKNLRQRAIRLMERAILLIDQNTDPEISELFIYIDMADCYFGMDEAEKAVELLKSNNPCGINDALIGQILASACDSLKEAVSYLSVALLNNISSFIRIVSGYYNVYYKEQEFASAIDILHAAFAFLEHFRESDKSSFLDRISAIFYICLASAQIGLDDTDAARESLHAAKKAADDFDRMPDYKGNSIRFVSVNAMTAFDDLGSTAKEAVLNLIQDIKSEALSALWEEIDHAG